MNYVNVTPLLSKMWMEERAKIRDNGCIKTFMSSSGKLSGNDSRGRRSSLCEEWASALLHCSVHPILGAGIKDLSGESNTARPLPNSHTAVLCAWEASNCSSPPILVHNWGRNSCPFTSSRPGSPSTRVDFPHGFTSLGLWEELSHGKYTRIHSPGRNYPRSNCCWVFSGNWHFWSRKNNANTCMLVVSAERLAILPVET